MGKCDEQVRFQLKFPFIRCFYPKPLTLHPRCTFTFYQSSLSLGIDPTTLLLLYFLSHMSLTRPSKQTLSHSSDVFHIADNFLCFLLFKQTLTAYCAHMRVDCLSVMDNATFTIIRIVTAYLHNTYLYLKQQMAFHTCRCCD